jgi:hypothetical protein
MTTRIEFSDSLYPNRAYAGHPDDFSFFLNGERRRKALFEQGGRLYRGSGEQGGGSEPPSANSLDHWRAQRRSERHCNSRCFWAERPAWTYPFQAAG